ncbi:signal peptidase I [Haladaptatus sp. DFWS20]|uniref:signal peptidase I n=1 Tax=Haladaptatus sp. DFWS20 TaxID=3403467 RepID=UPI003EBD08D0
MSPLSDPGLRRVLHVGGLAIIAAGVLLMAIVMFPQVIGADQSYVVVSGSMSPSMHAGDVVVVRATPAASIEAGDVITFEYEGEATAMTHRVVEVVQRDGQVHFQTKGDASEEVDSRLVPASNVTGTVWFHIPYLGHLLHLAQSKLGILALILVPAVLLVATELYSLANAVNSNDGSSANTEREEREPEPTEGSQ